MSQPVHVRKEGRGSRLFDYAPLGALVATAALAAIAIAAGRSDFSASSLMHAYMGVFLVIFSLLKLFDLKGFKDGFAMYDLLARRAPFYGYAYPFLELGLGLAYLAHAAPQTAYAATVALFAFGALGVVLALRRGVDLDCPCMGNVLTVPLSTVTLSEDLLMAGMAGMLLAR